MGNQSNIEALKAMGYKDYLNAMLQTCTTNQITIKVRLLKILPIFSVRRMLRLNTKKLIRKKSICIQDVGSVSFGIPQKSRRLGFLWRP